MNQPKTKTLTVKNLTSVRKYLTLFSGIFQLTEAELDVLAEMIRYKLKGLYARTDSDPFSTSAKKHIAKRLEMSNPYSINTYLQRLRRKGAIVNNQFHPWLVPMGETKIEITLEWKLNLE